MDIKIGKSTAQMIVEAVKEVCGHDINYIDTKGYIFASTDNKRIGDYHEIGMRVAALGETIEVSEEDAFWGTQPGINAPLFYEGKLVAVIGITGSPDEVRKYSHLAERISLLTLREHEITSKRIGQQTATNFVIRSLVNGDPLNMQMFGDFMQAHHLKMDASYRTAVIETNTRYNPANLGFIEKDIYDIVDTIPQSLHRFQYPNEFVVIFESSSLKHTRNLLQKLLDKYPEILRISIGNENSIFKQNKSYDSAILSLKCNINALKVAIYDEFDLGILLVSLDDSVINRYLTKTIAGLNDEELELLYTYYEANMSLKETSEKLFIHKNTLQYKLDRIYEKTSYNPRCFKEGVILYVALKILQAHPYTAKEL